MISEFVEELGVLLLVAGRTGCSQVHVMLRETQFVQGRVRLQRNFRVLQDWQDTGR